MSTTPYKLGSQYNQPSACWFNFVDKFVFVSGIFSRLYLLLFLPRLVTCRYVFNYIGDIDVSNIDIKCSNLFTGTEERCVGEKDWVDQNASSLQPPRCCRCCLRHTSSSNSRLVCQHPIIHDHRLRWVWTGLMIIGLIAIRVHMLCGFWVGMG